MNWSRCSNTSSRSSAFLFCPAVPTSQAESRRQALRHPWQRASHMRPRPLLSQTTCISLLQTTGFVNETVIIKYSCLSDSVYSLYEMRKRARRDYRIYPTFNLSQSYLAEETLEASEPELSCRDPLEHTNPSCPEGKVTPLPKCSKFLKPSS